MSEITMCKGEDCPIRINCWRYTAKPTTYWQSYFVKAPYNDEKRECENYWPIRKEKKTCTLSPGS